MQEFEGEKLAQGLKEKQSNQVHTQGSTFRTYD